MLHSTVEHKDDIVKEFSFYNCKTALDVIREYKAIVFEGTRLELQ